jgi:hypothetical protein
MEPGELPGKLIHSPCEGKAAHDRPVPFRSPRRTGKRFAMILHPPRYPLLILAFVMLAGVLSACGGNKRNTPPCPRVGILGDAQKVTQYRDGPGRDLTDVTFEAELLDYNGGCKFEDKQSTVVISFILQVGATRGPAASKQEALVPYFVALVDTQQNILSRERFVARIPFKEGQRRIVVGDEFEQVLPLQGRRTTEFEILIGLEVPPDQLNKVRQQRGF